MIRSLVVAALLGAIGACYHGPSAETFELAQWPDGVAVDLRLSKSRVRVRGELLELQDSALIVLSRSQIVRVPIGSIRQGVFQERGILIENGRISERARTQMRLLSRFPAGLTPELRARLFAAYGQTDFQPARADPPPPPPPPSPVAPPPGDSALATFVARARTGTEPFRDPERARAVGYRPVGPDFPGMGRHWIHPTLILRDSLDPAQPPVLEYADITGRLTLVGVAYAALVKDGAPPTSLPVQASDWHFHQGTVEEESFLRSHAGLGHVMPGAEGPRIAVLHAWIWLDNPDGLLATDNWALPYARLGYPAPANISADAARALALAAGDAGRAYLEALLHAVGQPNADETTILAAVVARHQAAARAHVPNVTELEQCWMALWHDVQATVRPEVWERLQAVQ